MIKLFIFLRCETIKQEYDRLLSNKMSELNKLQSQVDELNEEINKIKQKYRKEIDAKDIDLKTTKLNHDNMKINIIRILFLRGKNSSELIHT